MPTSEELKQALAETLDRAATTKPVADTPPVVSPEAPNDAKTQLRVALESAEPTTTRTKHSRATAGKQGLAGTLRSAAISSGAPAYQRSPSQLPQNSAGVLVFGPEGTRRVGLYEADRIGLAQGTADPLRPGFKASLRPESPPKNVQIENAIRSLSGQLLDLPSQGMSSRTLAEARLTEAQKFDGQTSRISKALPQDTRNSLLEFTAKLNHQPASPSEEVGVLARQRSDWINAVASGQAAFGLGPNEPRAQALAAMDDGLFSEVAAKIAGNGLEAGEKLLNKEGPFGDETAAFRELSPGFFKFAAEKQKYYTASERWFTLTGVNQDQELRQSLAQTNLHDAVPAEPPFTVNNLGTLFPELLSIQQQASQAVAAESEALQARLTEEQKLDPQTQALLQVHRAGGAPGVLSKAAGELLDWLDWGTGRILSTAIHWADTKGNSAIPYQQFKAAIVRDRLQGMPAGADLEEQYSRLLQDHPDLEPDRLRQLAGSQLFTVAKLTEELPTMVEQLTGVDVATLVGASDEGLKEGISQWTAMFDNPASAVLSLGAWKGLRKRIGKAVDLQRTRSRSNALEAIDKSAGMADVAADLRAGMVDRTLQLVRRGATDSADARALMTKLTDRMQAEGIGITPEAIGTFRTAIDKLNSIDARTKSAGRVRRETRQVLGELDGAFSPVDFFRSEFVLDPGNRMSINPKSSSVMAEAARDYIDKAAVTAKHFEDSHARLALKEEGFPAARENRAFTRYRKAVAARIRDNELRNNAMQRHARARDIVKDVSQEIDHRVGALKETAKDVDAQVALELAEHNAGLRTASANAIRLEHEGGHILEANPDVKTKRYKRASELGRNTDAAESFLFSIDVKRTADAAQASHRLNKRGVASIGGPELVSQIQEIFAESTRLEGKVTRTASREAAHLLSDSARELANEFEAPIPRAIPARSAPRTKALNEISKKIEAAVADAKPAELTAAELTLLNEYRPAKAPLKPQFKQRNRALLATKKSLDSRITRESDFQRRLVDITQQIDELTPGDVTNFRIPKRLAKEIESRLAEDTTGLVYNKRTGLSLSEPSSVIRGHLELWRDLRRELPEEVRLLRRELIKQSSLELAALPLPHQIAASETFLREARRRENEVLRNTARIIDTLNRKIDPAERILITDSIREGRPHPKLKGDAAAYVQNEMLALRKEMLDFDLSIERLSPAKYAEFINERYTHDQYIPDADMRAEVRGSQLSDLSPSEQLNVATLDNRHFKFARPTDSSWVEWTDAAGKTQHRKGFKDVPAANKWAAGNLPEGTRFSSHLPDPLIDKIARGLDLDPGTSFGELMRRWSADQSKHLWQRQVSQLPDTLSGRTMAGKGASAAEISRGRALVQSTAGKWNEYVRIDDAAMPNLKGKWIPTETLLMAGEIFGGQKFLESQMRAWERTMSRFDNTSVGKIMGAANNVMSTAKVTINPGSYAKGWMGNAFYAHLSDFSPLNPSNVVSLLETVRQIGESMGSDGFLRLRRSFDANQTFSGKKVPSWLKEMIEEDLIHVGESLFDGALKRSKALSEHPRALESKMKDLRRRISELDEDSPSLGPAADRLAILEDQFRDASAKSLGDLVSNIGSALADELTGKQGAPGVTRLWNSYAVGSGDLIYKAGTYRHHRETLGKTRAEVSQMIRDNFQMFHDPQKWRASILDKDKVHEADVSRAVTNLLPGKESVGSTMFLGFKTEQTRILANAVQHAPKQLASFLFATALWNTSNIRGAGKSLEDYLGGFAQEEGLERNRWTDAVALTRDVFAGTAPSGALRMVSGDHIHGLWMTRPFGGLGGAISETIAGDSPNPALRLLGDTVGGTVGGLTFGNATFNILGSVLSGKTPRGTPVGKGSSARDWLDLFTESFAPGLIAGQDADRIPELFGADPEIDVQTWRPKDIKVHLAKRILGIREVQDPWRQVGRALHFRKTNRKEGHEAEFVANESSRNFLAHKVAQGVDPKTGKISRSKHREIVREHLAGKARQIVGPNQTVLSSEIEDSDEFKRAMRDTSLPKIANRFRHSPLTLQLGVYADFRVVNRTPSGPAAQVDQVLRQLMIQKAETSPPNRAARREAFETIQQFEGVLDPRTIGMLNQILKRSVR